MCLGLNFCLVSKSKVTIYENHFENPTYEEAFEGAKGYLIKARRGENENNLGLIW